MFIVGYMSENETHLVAADYESLVCHSHPSVTGEIHSFKSYGISDEYKHHSNICYCYSLKLSNV